MNDLLTTKEVANLHKISEARVRQLILEGKLPSKKFGRFNLIKKRDLSKVQFQGKAGRPRKITKSEENAA
jgi:excisionase family DNA binding protein